MYSKIEYEMLVLKYGSCSSWAIWDHKNENDLSVIDKNFNQLNSQYIFLALNISGLLKNDAWKNFHGGKHDRKLKYACNDTVLRGSYITDIFKGIPEVSSSRFEGLLTEEIINKNIDIFNQEMRDIKIGDSSKFVVLGVEHSLVARCFQAYFRQSYKNSVIYYYHYSYYRLTDKEWVTGLWRKLNIDKNYSGVIKQYVGKRD